MSPNLVFTYDVTTISYSPISQGTIPETTFTSGLGPTNFLNNTNQTARIAFKSNQYKNSLNVNYILTVYKNTTNVGTIEFSMTADQPFDPIRPYIFTLNVYNSKVTASSGIFQKYQNANLNVSINGNIRTITISSNCDDLCNLYHHILC
jgi:hypothetical protein